MDLLLVRHLWGTVGTPESLFPRFRAKGYGAVEGPIPSEDERGPLLDRLAAHGLGYVPMVFTEGATVADHVASFREQATAAAVLGPLVVTSHSGRDAWTEGEAAAFFGEALRIEADLGVPVAHETHRGRVLYAPWTAARVLDRFDRLRLCVDFSHWVCVAERLLGDQTDVVAEAARRAVHVHARVGYEEGPQVPDFRAPEYAGHVAAHEAWWDLVWDAQAARGEPVSTLTPEFGPPGYLHTLPYTNAPVADLEAVCDAQARRQAERFARRFGGAEGGRHAATGSAA